VQPKKPEEPPLEEVDTGGGTGVTLIVGGLILLLVIALIALMYLTFSN
jgi:hypothetical protein